MGEMIIAENSVDADLQITEAQKELKERIRLLRTVEAEIYELRKKLLDLGEAKRKAEFAVKEQNINIKLLTAEYWRLKSENL